MELRVETHQAVDILKLSGRLDLVSSSALKDMIRQRITDHRAQLILDLERITFINSSGLGALISCLRDIRLSGGRIVLCQMAPYISEIFAITGLTRVFDCYPSVPDALESFSHLPREAALRN